MTGVKYSSDQPLMYFLIQHGACIFMALASSRCHLYFRYIFLSYSKTCTFPLYFYLPDSLYIKMWRYILEKLQSLTRQSCLVSSPSSCTSRVLRGQIILVSLGGLLSIRGILKLSAVFLVHLLQGLRSLPPMPAMLSLNVFSGILSGSGHVTWPNHSQTVRPTILEYRVSIKPFSDFKDLLHKI